MALPRAVAVVVIHEGQFLFIRRGVEPFRGWWSPVTGRVEAGETLEAAAIREAHEEMGIEVEIEGECFHVCPTLDGNYELNFFRARWVGGKARPDPDEVAEWGWFSKAEIAKLDPCFEQDLVALEAIEI